MTVETEVCNGEIVERCDLDMSSYQDLSKGSGDCNGVSHVEEEGIVGSGKGDSDSSYVFVSGSGSDAVSDDYGEKDEDEKDGKVELVQEASEAKDEIEAQVGELSIQNKENDQLHDGDCCFVEGTVVSSSTDKDVPVESTGKQVLERDLVEEPDEKVGVVLNGALKTDDQTNLESGSEQSNPESGADQTSLESGAEQTILESGADHTILESGSDQNDPESTAILVEEPQSQILVQQAAECELMHLDNAKPKADGLADLGSSKEIAGSQEFSIAVLETSKCKLPRKYLESTGIVVEEPQPQTVVAEAAKRKFMHSDYGNPEVHGHVDLVFSGEKAGRQESPNAVLETTEGELPKNNPESTAVVVEEPQAQIVVPEAAECELMHLDNGNPKVAGHGDLVCPKEVAGSQETPKPVLETIECELPQLEDGEVKDAGQNNLEPVALVQENEGSQIMNTNSDESELHHQLNNGQEEVQGESKSLLETRTKEKQESEITGSEDIPSDTFQEKQALELDNEIPSGGPPVGPGMNLEPNLKLATAKTNAQLEAEIAVGSVLVENEDAMPIEHGTSETEVGDELVDGKQSALELFVSSENAESNHVNVRVEDAEGLATGIDNGPVVEPEENGCLLITKGFPTCAADGAKQEAEVLNYDAMNSANVISCQDGDTTTEIEAEDCPSGDHTKLSSLGNVVRSATIISFGSINVTCGDVNLEPYASKGIPKFASSKPASIENQEFKQADIKDSVENGSSLPTPVAEMKSESEVENISATSYRDVSETKFLNDSVVNSGSVANGVPDAVDVEIEQAQINTEAIDVESEGDPVTSVNSDDKLMCQEAGNILSNETSSSLEGSSTSTDALDSQNGGAEVGKQPFYFLIRVPRYDDEKFREEIKLAQLQVDDKTKSRDVIRSEIQMRRAVCKEHSENFDAAIAEERTARELLKSKFQEMDSVQSVINRVKNAMSVKDIDDRIRNMEHTIEHETLPLKEEKQLIRDIKQLKNVREQLSSSMGNQDEVQQALDQKSQIEERSKFLREEVDSLKYKVQKAEAVTKAAKKKYYDETEKLNQLQARFKAADDIRQEAYTHLQGLRKNLSQKNKYFRMYKDDLKEAIGYASARDKEALQRHCVNQVETIMGLWNNNDEFRKEYIRCNTRSTLRRLRTLDGRSLGPDEEPPILHNFNDRSRFTPTKGSSVPLVLTAEPEKRTLPAEAERSADGKFVTKAVSQRNLTAKDKKPTKPAMRTVPATVSGKDESEETREEEQNDRTKQEEESDSKAEELRKEEEAARLKEQRRLEEKAKSKEAQERKKRSAEKAQARAELRAQKEAEQRQKEREKKARKKERKKSSALEATNGYTEAEPAPILEAPSETTTDSKTIEKPSAVTKKPQKSSQFAKQQTKSKSIPPPLRNRGKRRIQPWMWVLVSVLFVLALFLLGNSSFSLNLSLQND